MVYLDLNNMKIQYSMSASTFLDFDYSEQIKDIHLKKEYSASTFLDFDYSEQIKDIHLKNLLDR
jgi:hypothetical protein